MPEDFKRTTHATLQDTILVTSRYFARLAALCDGYNLPTTIQSQWMADNNYRLDVITYVQPGTNKATSKVFREPKDWLRFSKEANVDVINAPMPQGAGLSVPTVEQLKTITIPSTSVGGGTMGAVPAVALVPIAGEAAAVVGGSAAATAAGAVLLSPPGIILICSVLLIGGAIYLVNHKIELDDARLTRMDNAKILDNAKITEQQVAMMKALDDCRLNAKTPEDHAKCDKIQGDISAMNKLKNWEAAKSQGLGNQIFGDDFMNAVKNIAYAAAGVGAVVLLFNLYNATKSNEPAHSAPALT
jgi:hypothetical protein